MARDNVVDGEGLHAGAGLVTGANASALGPYRTDDTYHKRRVTQRTIYVTTPLCRRAVRRSMARDNVAVHGLGPALMGRPELYTPRIV